MTWRVGQRAVCVETRAFFDARECFSDLLLAAMAGNRVWPVVGGVYVIADIRRGCDTCGGPRLVLEGFVHFSFHHLCFRPAVDAVLDRLAEIAANPPALAPGAPAAPEFETEDA